MIVNVLEFKMRKCCYLSLQRARVASGADLVKSELDALNRRYMELMADQNRKIHQLKSVYDSNGAYFPVSNISKVCIL